MAIEILDCCFCDYAEIDRVTGAMVPIDRKTALSFSAFPAVLPALLFVAVTGLEVGEDGDPELPVILEAAIEPAGGSISVDVTRLGSALKLPRSGRVATAVFQTGSDVVPFPGMLEIRIAGGPPQQPVIGRWWFEVTLSPS